MTSFQIFIAASILVILALLTSLFFWIQIRGKVEGNARVAATLFALCFALYATGQSLVIIESLKLLPYSDISSYLYALAAIVFAFGSWEQYKSTRK